MDGAVSTRASRVIGTWIGHEAVAIWHLDRWQRAPVEDRPPFDDSIRVQQERRQGVNLVRLEGAGGHIGHGAIEVIPDGGGVRPVTADGEDGVGGVDAPAPTDQGRVVGPPLAVLAVTGRAQHRIEPLPFAGGPAPGRQTGAGGRHGDVSDHDLLRPGRSRHTMARRGRPRTRPPHQRGQAQQNLKRESPPHPGAPSRL
jgi:hypothetical protein